MWLGGELNGHESLGCQDFQQALGNAAVVYCPGSLLKFYISGQPGDEDVGWIWASLPGGVHRLPPLRVSWNISFSLLLPLYRREGKEQASWGDTVIWCPRSKASSPLCPHGRWLPVRPGRLKARVLVPECQWPQFVLGQARWQLDESRFDGRGMFVMLGDECMSFPIDYRVLHCRSKPGGEWRVGRRGWKMLFQTPAQSLAAIGTKTTWCLVSS